jgi:transcriptional regulator with XRE-family HTH domain
MGRRPVALTSSQGSPATGIVSGAVLKLARQSTGLTQEKLAEALGVDVTTIQGWESGRRPVAAMSAGDFLRLCGRLARLGAPASTGRHLREAIEADQVLSTGVTAGASWVGADAHPLAASVHRWTITNLITWPLLGTRPQHLNEFTTSLTRRGPTPKQPTLGIEERARFLDHLLAVAEQGTHADEALLRRQAVYLLGFDGRPHVVQWLRTQWHRASRQPLKHADVAGLLEARSASVALAAAGDATLLEEFVDHTTDTHAQLANLAYWAHWIGETSGEQTTDAFMRNHDTRAWTGDQLLRHLTARIDPYSPHLPLNLHTLHALVASRPSILSGKPTERASLDQSLTMLASTDRLSRTGRDQLAGLQYALRLADR